MIRRIIFKSDSVKINNVHKKTVDTFISDLEDDVGIFLDPSYKRNLLDKHSNSLQFSFYMMALRYCFV